MAKPETVTGYIDQASGTVRDRLIRMRDILQSVAPEAELTLKWGKPVLMMTGRILFAFAAAKKHITFTPTGPALNPFAEELKEFVVTKDSIQFSNTKPLPEDLIIRIAALRVKEVTENNAKWRY